MDILNAAFAAHGELKRQFFRALAAPTSPPADTEATIRRYLKTVKAEEFIHIDGGLITRPSFHQCIAAHLPYHVDNCHRAHAVKDSKFDRWQWFITFFTPKVYYNPEYTPDWAAPDALHFDLMLHRPWMLQLLKYCGEALPDDDPRVIADRYTEGDYDYC